MAELVTVARDGDVLVIRLNRPEKKNAMTRVMYDAVVEAFAAADRDGARRDPDRRLRRLLHGRQRPRRFSRRDGAAG